MQYSTLTIFPALAPLVLMLLLWASCLHWRKSRDRYLLAFAAATVSLLLAIGFQYAALLPLRGRPAADIRAGRAKPNESYLQTSSVLTNVGLVLAAAGSVGSILQTLRRRLPRPSPSAPFSPPTSPPEASENPYRSPSP